MKAPAHHGVVLVLTNPERTHFLLQRKDASYPHFPRGYSFFGGALEDGETEEAGLQRELAEEFSEEVRVLLRTPRRRRFSGWIETEQFRFKISLFESTLSHDQLQTIASMPVLEGESADLIAREKLNGLAYVWGLEQLVPVLLGPV
ncbi:MAG: NUDIX domain-containing protein [Planctomycetota bacterium]|nr:NUDIX domain-containing protein [Planctomycetota bacterium]